MPQAEDHRPLQEDTYFLPLLNGTIRHQLLKWHRQAQKPKARRLWHGVVALGARGDKW